MKPKRRVLAGAAGVLVLLGASCSPVRAQWAVIDSANIAQTTVSALENVRQTAKQIQQYQTQLQQYENMLRNTAKPVTNIWDQAQSTMNALRRSIDTLSYYKTTLGNIDNFLARTKDTAGYRNSPCFSVNGCTPEQWEAIRTAELLGSEAQKKANDALFRGLDQQQDAMIADARQLELLQAAAKSADGQVQAIGYANQLASNQANQLLQIRGLLIAQQNAMAARNQALADREAMEEAAAARLRIGVFQRSPERNW